MSRNQGHVSLSGETAARLRAYCEINGVSQSKVVEGLIAKLLLEQPEDLLDEVRVAEEAALTAPGASVANEMYERSRRIP